MFEGVQMRWWKQLNSNSLGATSFEANPCVFKWVSYIKRVWVVSGFLYINRGRGVLRWPPNCAARLRKSTIHPHSDHSYLTRDGTIGGLNNALYAKLARHLHLNNMSFRWILLYLCIVNYDIFLSFIGTRAHMRRAQFSVQTYSPRHIRLKHT